MGPHLVPNYKETVFSFWTNLGWTCTTYCGWKKSCTTLDGWNPINNGINHLSTGAGFLPSTLDGWNPINNGINHLSTGAGFLPSTVYPNMFEYEYDIRHDSSWLKMVQAWCTQWPMADHAWNLITHKGSIAEVSRRIIICYMTVIILSSFFIHSISFNQESTSYFSSSVHS